MEATNTSPKKSKDLLFLGIAIGALILINIILMATGSLKPNWQGLSTMLAAGFTIAIFSFVFKDNPIYKLAEHIYVGASAAYLFHMVWYDNIVRDLIQPIFKPDPGVAPQLSLLIPFVLGLFLLTAMSKKLGFLSRISYAFIIGFGAGQAIPNAITTSLIEQIGPTIQPIFNGGFQFDLLVILIGVVSVLVYFFFSLEHKGVVGKVSRVGIWFLMVSFGASFGYTVMARMSLLIGRINLLFGDWIPLIK